MCALKLWLSRELAVSSVKYTLSVSLWLSKVICFVQWPNAQRKKWSNAFLLQIRPSLYHSFNFLKEWFEMGFLISNFTAQMWCRELPVVCLGLDSDVFWYMKWISIFYPRGWAQIIVDILTYQVGCGNYYIRGKGNAKGIKVTQHL